MVDLQMVALVIRYGRAVCSATQSVTIFNASGENVSVICPYSAMPPVVPALGNYLVALFKDTPLLSAIAVLELMQTAKIIGSEYFRYTEPITLVGAIFLVFSLVAAGLIKLVEAALRRRFMRV